MQEVRLDLQEVSVEFSQASERVRLHVNCPPDLVEGGVGPAGKGRMRLISGSKKNKSRCFYSSDKNCISLKTF